MKKRYTEEQIIGFLRDGETGIGVKDLCRKHGFSEASYYLWKSKFGGMSVSDAKRLKELETENARLKKLLAESVLENEGRGKHCEKNGDRIGAARAATVWPSAGVCPVPGGRERRKARWQQAQIHTHFRQGRIATCERFLVGNDVRRQDATPDRKPDQSLPHQFIDAVGDEGESRWLADALY